MEWTTPQSRRRVDEFRAVAPQSVAAFDMDGTLSPIVDDPAQARIHPEAAEVLVAFSEQVAALAIVTGRPAAQAVDLGDLDTLADRLGDTPLVVLGQYGHERWSALERRVISPEPPEGLARFAEDLPGLLEQAAASQAYVEHKGLAIAVHTRRLEDAPEAFERLVTPLSDAAERHGLLVEPGRHVLEIRATGADKGTAVRALTEEFDARGFLFVGDDLGDIPAFEAVASLRDEVVAGLLVCAGSTEQSALRDLADVTVDGPEGVIAFVRHLLD